MGDTKIEWADKTWNPVIGCTAVSEGCEQCYACKSHTMRHKAFLAGKKLPKQYAKPFSEIQFLPGRLDEPLHWRKPANIFVDSMGDLFHEDVPFGFIDKVLATMALCPRHTFQVLTKRPKKMAEYFNQCNLGKNVADAVDLKTWFNKGIHEPLPDYIDFNPLSETIYFPLPNIWLGVTAENQQQADMRIPILLQIPAAKRFVSLEPLLGPMDTSKYLWVDRCEDNNLDEYGQLIDWVIVGCETGKGRRPCKIEWVRSIVEQCRAADVPVFVKKLDINGRVRPHALLRKPKQGGVSKDPNEWPEDLRLRESPKGIK